MSNRPTSPGTSAGRTPEVPLAPIPQRATETTSSIDEQPRQSDASRTQSLRERLRLGIRQLGPVLKPVERMVRKARNTGLGLLGYYRIRSLFAGLRERRLAAWQNVAEYGAFADSTAKAADRPLNRDTILVMGHDAQRAGAQMIVLQMLDWLKRTTSLDVRLVLGRGGPLLRDYRKLADVIVLDELTSPYRDLAERRLVQAIRRHAGPNVKLVYANTLATGRWLDLVANLGVPVLMHVHELEESIQRYFLDDIARAKKHAARYIAASPTVAANLTTGHGVSEKQIESIYDFISESENACELPDKRARRRKLRLAQDKTIIFGCGTAYWRKGSDLFIDVAADLLGRGVTDFHFYWIGEDIEGAGRDVRRRGLASHVTFLGPKKSPREWFPAGDLFLLTSREDPFPLVCLEAAESGLPVICFDDAGGMPDFVRDDAGFVVPFADVAAMADKVATLIDDPAQCAELGGSGRNRVLLQHTSDRAMPEILHCVRKTASIPPRVSIIVPCYNHAAFLQQRLDSIFGQTYQDFEVIILDDGSQDDTPHIIEQYRHHPHARVFVNEENSGNTFAQWMRGIELARGELIWIAEDDDFCETTLLERLVPCFEDPDVRFAYCQSIAVDEEGHPLFNYTINTDEFSKKRWKSHYLADITEELNAGLAVRNTIPNASSAVFRKFPLHELQHELPTYRLAGDWVFYMHAIRGGKVAFHASSLNFHRRHRSTCIARYEHDPLRFAETMRAHDLARSLSPLRESTLMAMDSHLDDLRRECGRRAA